MLSLLIWKFNLGKLYEKIGVNNEIISRGRFAELTAAEHRPRRPDEAELFAKSDQNAYKQFRDKAALSRSMTVDEMEEVAQGRVWSSGDAALRGLVDAIGGFSLAVAIAKQKANIPQDRKVTLVELSRPSILPEILSGIGNTLVGGDRALKELLQELAWTASCFRSLMVLLMPAPSHLISVKRLPGFRLIFIWSSIVSMIMLLCPLLSSLLD